MNTSITANLYVFETTVDSFVGNKFWAQFAAKRGAALGITFEEGEAVARVVCAEPERWSEDYSWQDHGLPKALVKALNIDEEEAPSGAPCVMPVRMLEQLAKDGELIIQPPLGVGKVTIKFVICPQQKDNFGEILEAIQQPRIAINF